MTKPSDEQLRMLEHIARTNPRLMPAVGVIATIEALREALAEIERLRAVHNAITTLVGEAVHAVHLSRGAWPPPPDEAVRLAVVSAQRLTDALAAAGVSAETED